MVDLVTAGDEERSHQLRVPTPVEDLRRRVVRRRRCQTALLVPVVAAACLGVVAVLRAGHTTSSVVGVGTGDTTTGQSVPPPAMSLAAPYLWLSTTEVPAGGADLAAVVVNPTGGGVSYGVAGTLQHWNGTTWAAAGYWYSRLEEWGGPGRITAKQQPVVAIGLSAPAHGQGPAEFLAVPALPPGWYRVAHGRPGSAPVASGIFHVSPKPATPAPISNPLAPPTLTASPVLLPPAGGTVSLVGQPETTGQQITLASDRLNRGLSRTVTVEHWDGRGWHLVTTLTAQPATSAPGIPEHTVTITVPPEPSGAYRLTRNSTRTAALSRVIWVSPAVPQTIDSRPTTTVPSPPGACTADDVTTAPSGVSVGTGQTSFELRFTLSGSRPCELAGAIHVALVEASGATLAATPDPAIPTHQPVTLSAGPGVGLTVSYAAFTVNSQNCPGTPMTAAVVTIGTGAPVTVHLPAGAVFVCNGTTAAISALQRFPG